MTTTSEDAPGLSPPSPQLQITMTPKTARPRTPSRRSISPIKQRTPFRVSSPVKVGTFSRSLSLQECSVKNRVQSTKAVSFTPQRTRQPPRAWERRPATPFVPRDDKQKIWKRVPLGELGVDVNQPIGISRREQEGNKDYARVVKKLKIGHNQVGSEEDKENFAADAKMANEEHDLKQPRSCAGYFVSMKTEEDVIWESPKKKVRQQPHEERLEEIEDVQSEEASSEYEQEEKTAEQAADNLCDMLEIRAIGEEMDVAGGASTSEQYTSTENDGVVEMNADQGLQYDENQVEIAAEVHSHDTSMYSVRSSIDDVKSLQDGSPLEEMQVNSVNNITTSENSDVKDDGDLQLARDQVSAAGGAEEFAQGESEKAHGIISGTKETNTIALETSGMDAVSDTPERSQWKIAQALCADGLTEVDEDATSDLHNDLAEEPQSSSPPTILAENIVVDELASLKSPSKQPGFASEDEEDMEISGGQAPESDVEAIQKIAAKRVSDDETAFLQSFLSRTKAQWAARDLKVQQTVQNDLSTPQEEADISASHATPGSEASTEGLASPPHLEAPAENQAEQQPSSPLRRSKRAAVTSLPRPQTLPNAIQLKRASGNEFIFTANKTSSVANVAIATRTNTKRNKGSALNVHARLEQLLAEKDKEANGDSGKNGAEDPSEEGMKDKGVKKRKRDKSDDGKRSKKALRWNDEYLVSYQEPPEKNDEWEDIDDSSQDSIKDEVGNTGGTKITLTMSSASSRIPKPEIEASTETTKHEKPELESVQKDQRESSSTSQSKVRRVRRGIAGSVNGTPGPKTRSKKIMLESDVEVPGTDDTRAEVQGERGFSLEDSAAATAALSNLAAEEGPKSMAINVSVSTRRSRMPVPSARKGAAASASIRTANPASKLPAPAALIDKEKKEEKTKENEEPKGDLLGKRRLRVRS